VVQANYNSGAAGSWARLGPYTVNLTDGAINIATSGGTANVSGIELWNAGSAAATATPTPAFCVPPGSAQGLAVAMAQSLQNGLFAEYFNNLDFTGCATQRIDPDVEWHWKTDMITDPAAVDDLPANLQATTFTVRWTGWLVPPTTGNYIFGLKADDGARLYINDVLLIEDWNQAAGHPYPSQILASQTQSLQAGQRYEITVEYFQLQFASRIEFGWITPTSQGIYAPVPTSVLYPIDTPPTNVSPTATPTPAGQTYHVACSIASASVRNYPAGDPSVPQIDGRVMFTLSAGTIVNVIEFRPARDGILWARISDYEFNGRDTLWIRTKQPNNTTDILVAGNPTACSGSPANLLQATQPPPALSFPIGSPGCVSGRNCNHQTITSQVDLVAWIIACEAFASSTNLLNGAVEDAIANAHVVFNRMDSLTYAGSAYDVVRQAGQWQPYTEGCSLPPALNQPAIQQAAQSVVNEQEPQAAPFNILVDWLALYTFGVSNPNGAGNPPPSESVLLAPFCPNVSDALRVYLAYAPFGARPNASVFFSDSPGCTI
jgi:hypothetical protein